MPIKAEFIEQNRTEQADKKNCHRPRLALPSTEATGDFCQLIEKKSLGKKNAYKDQTYSVRQQNLWHSTNIHTGL